MADMIYSAEDVRNSSYAENSLAGSILIDPKNVINAIRGKVDADDFDYTEPKAVFIAACQLADGGKELDPVSIQAKAKENGMEISSSYIIELMKITPTAANCESYAETVHNAAIDREAKSVGFNLREGYIGAEQAVERLQSVLGGKKTTLPTEVEDAMRFYSYVQSVASGETKPFIETGFAELDEKLGGGLAESGLIVLAARPGMGKTTIGLAIADNIAKSGGRVLYESLEMSREQLWARRCGRLTGLSCSTIQSGRGIPTEKNSSRDWWKRISNATQELSERPMQISDANSTLDDIERRIRSIDGLTAVVIDHMGLIQFADKRDDLYTGTTKISHRLKQIARSTGVPILALCQLSRANEQRGDKRPQLSDLRNSGAIEEDADAVIMLHRPEYYMEKEKQSNPWDAQQIYVMVEKNRHGQTGFVTMDYIPCNARITETVGKSDAGLPM